MVVYICAHVQWRWALNDSAAPRPQVLKFLASIPTARLPLVPLDVRCLDTEMIGGIGPGPPGAFKRS